MDNATLLPSLNLFTLIAVLVLLVLSFAYFLRKRRNRQAASHALGIDDSKPSNTFRS
ncbi:MAG: LPXTG cell wall anchor domain-containing protein [Methylobacteriaceae bacterium]|nr:LPXTG cell wall anchor domain-containing protein [Methylobacteriaceae bacterium]